MNTRIEKDTLGEVAVPADQYWGAQTERSRHNFPIGPVGSMPIEVVHAFGHLKMAAAKANCEAGVLTEAKRDLIVRVCGEKGGLTAKVFGGQRHLCRWFSKASSKGSFCLKQPRAQHGHMHRFFELILGQLKKAKY